MRIVHLTSVHPSNDVRIFGKMCRSLAESGHEVHLIAPDANRDGFEIRDRVAVHAAVKPGNRFDRMKNFVPALLDRAADLRGDIYHFHDPEFLTRSVRFQKRVRRPVIYDAHEDLRLDVREKLYIPWGLRQVMGIVSGCIEDSVCARMAGIVAATPFIASRFDTHPNCSVVQNFPIVGEFDSNQVSGVPVQPNCFTYVGGLAPDRGIRETLMALDLLASDTQLELAGPWASSQYQRKCMSLPGWRKTNYHGVLDRNGIGGLLSRSVAGVVTLHPTRPFQVSYAVKMFEYMAAELPVIASDFLLWRSIINEADCGLLVNPLDPEDIARAMQWILDHPDEGREMGQRGKRAILDKYNWASEFSKLSKFYSDVVESFTPS